MISLITSSTTDPRHEIWHDKEVVLGMRNLQFFLKFSLKSHDIIETIHFTHLHDGSSLTNWLWHEENQSISGFLLIHVGFKSDVHTLWTSIIKFIKYDSQIFMNQLTSLYSCSVISFLPFINCSNLLYPRKYKVTNYYVCVLPVSHWHIV